jgi:nickel-dependent lactate racemase
VIVKLPSGSEALAVDLRGLRVRPLAPSAPPGARDLPRLVGAELDRPLEGRPLSELARGRSEATIVVPDATRKVELPAVLPAVLTRLARAGIEGGRVTVLVACGTHPPAAASALASLVGLLPAGVSIVQHDAGDDGALVRVGSLADGTAIRLHRLAVEASLLITIGGVRHHYFAGFGGGPKMVFPGVGGYREIQTNHARVLRRRDGRLERDPGCEPGVLAGNPVAEEIATAADLRPPDCALCLVPGSDGRPAFAAAGPWRVAFTAAVDRARGWYEVDAARFPLGVASAGGSPSDATLIQAHKGLDAACRFLEPGGELLFVAELAEGSGSPAMQPFLDDPRPEAILERLSREWVQYGHTTLRLVTLAARHRVHLVSSLDDALARRLGFLPARDPSAVVDGWQRTRGGDTVAVNAGQAVYPRAAPAG